LERNVGSEDCLYLNVYTPQVSSKHYVSGKVSKTRLCFGNSYLVRAIFQKYRIVTIATLLN
jgi:hypothetical protein